MGSTSTISKLEQIDAAISLCMEYLPENAKMVQIRDVLEDAREACNEMLTERLAKVAVVMERIEAIRAGKKKNK